MALVKSEVLPDPVEFLILTGARKSEATQVSQSADGQAGKAYPAHLGSRQNPGRDTGFADP